MYRFVPAISYSNQEDSSKYQTLTIPHFHSSPIQTYLALYFLNHLYYRYWCFRHWHQISREFHNVTTQMNFLHQIRIGVSYILTACSQLWLCVVSPTRKLKANEETTYHQCKYERGKLVWRYVAPHRVF